MNKSHLIKTVCAIGISAACLWGLSGCTTDNKAGGNAQGDGSVAAVVDGVEIYENEITNYIESLRRSYNMSDEETWGTYLVQSNITPASLRENVIKSFIARELEQAHAGDRGVSVKDSEIDVYVEQMKSNYDTEEKWHSALEQVGLTEDEYRHEIKLQLINRYLVESFVTDEKPAEADQLQYAQMYASTYDGAKRSSHILFASDNKQTAQEVLDKIKAGELSFAEAAEKYSQDSGSAVKGGDVGWDKTSRLVDEYQLALDGLEKGEISGLVPSAYGIHIIKCTDMYVAPKAANQDGKETVKITSLDQIPADWLDSINESLKSEAQAKAYRQWSEELYNTADIVINDIPEDVPYNIDLSKYEAAKQDTNDSVVDVGKGQNGNAAAASNDAPSASQTDKTGSGTTSGAAGDEPR